MPHFTYSEIVDTLTAGNFGFNGKDLDSTTQDVIDTDGTGKAMTFALMAALRAFSSALFPRRPQKCELGKPPSNAVAYPDIKIGDYLYSCYNLELGIDEYVVISKNTQGQCLVCDTGLDVGQDTRYAIRWALKSCFRSKNEALRTAAKDDVEYHKPRLEMAERLLAALDAGEDTSSYEHGMPIEY